MKENDGYPESSNNPKKRSNEGGRHHYQAGGGAAKPNASARDIALQLLHGLYSGMPVTDDEGRVIGIVTELDLLAAVEKGKELVRLMAADVMHKEVVTADVETPINEIVKIMTERNIIRLPVTAEGRLVGIVARCDVLRNYIQPEFVTYF